MLTLHTFTAPAHWASYLVNGDSSGMDGLDLLECDTMIADIVAKHGSCHVCECSEPEFHNRAPCWAYGNGLGGDFCEYTHLVAEA